MSSELTRKDLGRMMLLATRPGRRGEVIASYCIDVPRLLSLVEELAVGLVASQPAIIPNAALSGKYLSALEQARALLLPDDGPPL